MQASHCGPVSDVVSSPLLQARQLGREHDHRHRDDATAERLAGSAA